MTTWWLLGMEGFEKPLPDPGNLDEPNHGLRINLPVSSDPSRNKSGNNSNQHGSLSCSQSGAQQTGRRYRPMTSGSSYVVATPLALVPPITSLKENFKPSKLKGMLKMETTISKTQQLSSANNQIQHKKNQFPPAFGKKTSVAPTPGNIFTICE
ncbi:unnamed protein product [Clavelina lepadiformis]|uniref:Uncharacterized protein n=1 Tax=Clavelina lepadiformis TaxID=159417 RepID=A0ABP0GG10_CLALP